MRKRIGITHHASKGHIKLRIALGRAVVSLRQGILHILSCTRRQNGVKSGLPSIKILSRASCFLRRCSAARVGKDAVELIDFATAIDRVVAGLERKSRVISPNEKAIAAYHEARHALVAEPRPHTDWVAKISIIPRAITALGFTQQQPTEDRYLMTRAELLERLDALLGGRTAEEIVFGVVSTGAQDDLQRATDFARHMIMRYGMSDAPGLATFEVPRQALFVQGPSGAPKEHLIKELVHSLKAQIGAAAGGQSLAETAAASA